jgi:hypothetical protein
VHHHLRRGIQQGNPADLARSFAASRGGAENSVTKNQTGHAAKQPAPICGGSAAVEVK